MINNLKLLLRAKIIIQFSIYVIVIFISCSSNESFSNKTEQKQNIYKVKMGKILNKLQLSGTIIPFRLIDVKSKISGEISELLVKVGDTIIVNDVIANLNPDPQVSLEFLKKDLNLWKKQLELKKIEHLFLEKQNLLNKGLISDKEYQESKYEYTILMKEFEILKLDLSIFKNQNGLTHSSIDSTSKQVALIRSPMSGTILKIPVQSGAFVRNALSQYGEGTTICTIGDLSEFNINIPVSEFDLPKIKIGQQVEIRLNDKSEVDFGVVTNISPIGNINVSPVTFDVTIQFKPVNIMCSPGMSANVDLIIGKKESILVLPIEAVLYKKSKGTVVIKTPEGPKIQKVQIGLTDNNFVEIISGLDENMEVYSKPKIMIKKIVLKK